MSSPNGFGILFSKRAFLKSLLVTGSALAENLAASLRGIAASNMTRVFGEFLMSSPNGFGIFFSKRVFLNIFWNFDAETGYRI